MNRLTLATALAVAGIAVAAVVMWHTNREPEADVAPLSAPPAPFAQYVVGNGIIENQRGNVAVGAPVAGVVGRVDVRVGDAVHAGQILFRLDDRDLVARRSAAVAHLREAEVAAEKPRHRYDYLQRLQASAPGDISREALSSARDERDAADAAIASARADAAQIDVDIERLVVRAPAAGKVLQVNVRPGEYVDGAAAKAPVLLGDDSRMFLRVDIDENDAWRFRPGARARGVLRGNPAISVEMRFEYAEPYVMPKTSLTGQGTERTDQRVLQVVYSFARGALPLYFGQQMDAYIEAPKADAVGAAPTTR